jgi:outer membrane protein assembly factor BamB
MVTVLVTVSAAALVSARSVALPDDDVPLAAAFIPADGETTVSTLSNAGGATVLVQEHQRAVGFRAVTSLPDAIAAQVLFALPDDDLGTRLFWLATSRQMRGGLVGPQTIDVLTVDGRGIQRLASFGGSVPSIYQPPLLLFPEGAVAGTTWNATGSALFDGVLRYDQRASVERIDDDGCVVIAYELAVNFGDVPFTSQEGVDRWCPGRGVVSATLVYDQGGGPEPIEFALAEDPVALVAGEPRPPLPVATDGGDPATWVATELTPAKRDPYLGDMTVDGVSGVPPVAGSGGLMVVVLGNGSQVVGFRVGEPAENAEPGPPPLLELWRVHPGGNPLAVAVLGDLVVVATSQRRLVAYDVNGVRRWLLSTDDLVLRPPVRVTGADTDVVVIHDLSGRVIALDAVDGSVRWTERTRADSDLPPARLGEVVVVADRSGDLVGFDGASGRRVWVNRQPSIDAIGAVGDGVVVARGDGTVIAVDRRGVQQWSTRVDTRADRIDEIDGRPVIIGRGRVTVLDPTSGRVRWSRASEAWADAWSGGLAVVDDDSVCVFDADGRTVACWPRGGDESMVRVFAAATEEGVWVLDSGLGVTFIGPPLGGNGS